MGHELIVGVVIPTLNAGKSWAAVIDGLKTQSLLPKKVLIVDSSSTDSTVADAIAAGFEVLNISRSNFNHGTTRQLALNMMSDVDVVVYLTQDAIIHDRHTLRNLIGGFDDPTIGVVYGRQLPHPGASPIGAHARLFNYPENSEVRSMNDSARLGIKAAFISNSFAAYRRIAIDGVGGFPLNTILSEDTYVAARMLLAGWKVGYMAEAKVFHSHDYSPVQDFKRYFDVGVFHARESWIRAEFGEVEGEGIRFALSEIRYLLRHSPWLIGFAVLRSILKLMGYRLGLHENRIPIKLKSHLSMHKAYWCSQDDSSPKKRLPDSN